MEMEPGLDHGRLGGLGHFGESDSVKMFDMSTVGGFREGITRIVAACVAIAKLPMFARILGGDKGVAIGVVTPDKGTGYMFSVAITALLSKIGVPMDVQEDDAGARLFFGPEKEAELLIVQDESDFDGITMIGGTVFSNVVDAEKILEQFRLRMTATFAGKEKS